MQDLTPEELETAIRAQHEIGSDPSRYISERIAAWDEFVRLSALRPPLDTLALLGPKRRLP